MAEDPFATWTDVRRHLVATYGARGGDAVEILLPLAAELPAGAAAFWADAASAARRLELGAQAVRVAPLEVLGAPWIDVTSVIGAPRHLPQLRLLEDNRSSPVGAYCLLDGRVAVRQTLPLAGLAAADLDDTLRGLAHAAAWAGHRMRE